MLFQISNGTVSLGGQTILSHIDFSIKGREKIAVVGRNGAGKTTLLKLILGELSLDRDDKRHGPGITSSRDVTIEMMRQTVGDEAELSMEELIQSDMESMEYEVEYNRLMTGFGFSMDVKKKPIKEFSGGEQTKLSLIRYLLKKPDILLLDEPTNHLDIETVEWLEQYLKTYEKAIVFVSHDRFFLDQVVDTVYDLDGGRLKRYPGDYTHYRVQKQKDFIQQKKAYEKQQEEIRNLKSLIEKFKNKPKKASFARSRKTMLDRMELIEKPQEDGAHIFTGEIVPQVLGSKWVLEAEHLKIGYDQALLEIDLRLRRGQKIGIIGPNGSGKTTFLKTVAGFVEPLSGKFSMGNTILMGYFDQQSAALDSEKTVFEHFHEIFPGLLEKDARNILGSYLFRGADTAKRVSDLSGGEKARLVLCELITGRPNFMMLDEPTNHMDIQAKETLESAFRAYKGSMLFVSHDRYFISQVADAILVFGSVTDGKEVLYYPFGYRHYIEKKKYAGVEDLAGMIRAEDQARIADLRAVPKPERHRLKEIGTETAHVDWKLRLAGEPLDVAFSKVERLYEQFEDLDSLENYVKWQENLEKAVDDWTEACIEWYDVRRELIMEEDNVL